MDEVLRRGINALIKLPWMVTTPEAIEIHRAMAEILKARSFRINWILDEIYYDDGSPLLVSVIAHLTKISENKELAIEASMLTSGAFKAALDDPLDRIFIYQISYQMPAPGEMEEDEDGAVYPAQPKLIRTRFSLDEIPTHGATYALRIKENV